MMDCTNATIKSSCKFGGIRQIIFVKITHFFDLLVSESRIAVLRATENILFDSKNMNAMEHVFGSRHLFEIYQAVVNFISIFVIHFNSRRDRSFKCFYHQTVNHLWKFYAAFRKQNIFVSRSACSWLENFVCSQPSDVSEIADFVESFVTKYGFPSFSHVSSVA